MRQRKVNEWAVERLISFLEELKVFLDDGRKFNSSDLQKEHQISKSTFSICKQLNFVKNNKWIIEDPNRVHALMILEVLRQQASKRIDVALSDDFVTSIDRLTTSMNTLSVQNESGLNRIKSPMLSRALNQSEQSQGNHLFSQVESDESKKFELLKAIATGVYSNNLNSATLSFEAKNSHILLATEDLFNKFFKIKLN